MIDSRYFDWGWGDGDVLLGLLCGIGYGDVEIGFCLG